jgi:hypothetical protein
MWSSPAVLVELLRVKDIEFWERCMGLSMLPRPLRLLGESQQFFHLHVRSSSGCGSISQRVCWFTKLRIRFDLISCLAASMISCWLMVLALWQLWAWLSSGTEGSRSEQKQITNALRFPPNTQKTEREQVATLHRINWRRDHSKDTRRGSLVLFHWSFRFLRFTSLQINLRMMMRCLMKWWIPN